MLALAQRLHADAIAAISARPIDLAAAAAASKQLADCELLVADCLDWQHEDRLAEALAALRDQRRLLEQALAQPIASAPVSPWSTPWPWLTLALVAGMMLLA